LAAVQKLEQNLQQGKSRVYRFSGGRIKAAQDILQRRPFPNHASIKDHPVMRAGSTSENEGGEVLLKY
jgi:hypothetical protein